MSKFKHAWTGKLTAATTRKPWLIITIVLAVTFVAMFLAERLEMRTNWDDLLPAHHPTVVSYRTILERFGDPSVVIALEGDRDRIVAMAEALTPRLEEIESLYNIQAKMPVDFFADHGFALLKPEQFDRQLKIFSETSLLGTFTRLNDDYETEYTESESNLRRDEVEVARGLLSLARTLEVLEANLAGGEDAAAIEEAADVMVFGEPWLLSLDREMLLIACTPYTSIADDFEAVLETVREVQQIVDEIEPFFPDVRANLTGMAPIGLDEMESIGLYTQLLTLGALILIFILLARSFHGWVMPLIAITPLLVGIIWTMGLMQLLFGSLNLFTAMMMLVLLGLGIDFSIHLISRFREELKAGAELETAIKRMFRLTGVPVITGALTTALAFFTLMVGETTGVFEFGVAAGTGVILTLLAIFLMLPALLTFRHSAEVKRAGRLAKKSGEATGTSTGYADANGLPLLGRIARSGWNHPGIFIAVAAMILIAALWSRSRIEFEYNFLNLEPKGLQSVELQSEIPDRFGMSDHAAWSMVSSVEESRELKESFREQPLVGDVTAISDYIPPIERLEEYTPVLLSFRQSLESSRPKEWRHGDGELLAEQIDRLWDNLDLVSNLAFTAGLDRIVKVIDQITGFDSETLTTDESAVLPSVSRLLHEGVDDSRAVEVNRAWSARLRENLIRMSGTAPVAVDDLPETIRRALLPREGEGFLVQVVPRRSLWNMEDLERFDEQTTRVDPQITGTEQLIIIMLEETLADGRKAALLALLVISILLLIHFRGPAGLLAMIPLLSGALVMIGIMYLIGMKYNFMNLIAVPIILGIGIDDGVHALHRFREEASTGTDRIFNSYKHVGKAILLSSLTTMIGFGSIAFYTMRGMASFGIVLFIGVGSCFLATIFILPAVLRVFSKRTEGKRSSRLSTGETE